jgi:hypothetical protein
MRLKPIAAAWALLALAGCAHHAKAKPEPLNPLTVCPKDNPCNAVSNRRQYYDLRVARYYYFDTTKGRYYWENGEPRFPDATVSH